ncbi:hypothetical protein Y600_5909 [Burkholderia pseudomallei MSHR3709]|nr:hypothetical protein Y600_5909 [Burkholderia pseudomallei MSHR3709]
MLASSACFRNRCFWVTRTSVISLPEKAGYLYCSTIDTEAVDLPASSSLRLKRSQTQQCELVRMTLAGHQFPWTLSVAFGAPAAHEAPMIQEKAQQVEVRPDGDAA